MHIIVNDYSADRIVSAVLHNCNRKRECSRRQECREENRKEVRAPGPSSGGLIWWYVRYFALQQNDPLWIAM